MAKPFSQKDYESDKQAYEVVLKNIGKYFFMAKEHVEDYQIDCKLYDDGGNLALYLELEHLRSWNGSPNQYPKVNLLERKVKKYHHMDRPSIYVQFSKDFKRCRLTVFDSVYKDIQKGKYKVHSLNCYDRNGCHYDSVYRINPDEPYIKVIDTKDLEKVLFVVYRNYMKYKQTKKEKVN